MPDRTAIDLINAQRLRDAGRPQAPISLLVAIARESSDLFHQVYALSSAAVIATESDGTAAAALLEAARNRIAASTAQSEAMLALAACRTELVGWAVDDTGNGAATREQDYDRMLERLSRADALATGPGALPA